MAGATARGPNVDADETQPNVSSQINAGVSLTPTRKVWETPVISVVPAHSAQAGSSGESDGDGTS